MSRDETAPVVTAPSGDDAGFSIVEVVVAMVVFVVMTLAVLGILLSALGGSRTNAQRVQAASIAAQRMEAVRYLAEGRGKAADGAGGIRNSTIADIAGGVGEVPLTSTQEFNGTTFTITQRAAFFNGDGTVSICKGSGENPTYQRVSVEVTWPNQGSIPPVRSDTVIAVKLGKDGLSSERGILAVQVQDSKAGPVAGQPVVLSSGLSVTTDTDGCAVFTNLVPGTYQASMNVPGFVGLDSTQLATSGPLDAVAAKVRKGIIDYDRAGRLELRLLAPTGYALPAETTPFRVGEKNVRECTAATATVSCFAVNPTDRARVTVQRLFPAPYPTVVASLCADARPSPAAPGATVPQNGSSPLVDVPLAGVQIDTSKISNVSAGPTIFAHHAADAGCTDTVLNLGPTTGSTMKLALPQGLWGFSYGAALTGPTRPTDASTGNLKIAPPAVTPPIVVPKAGP